MLAVADGAGPLIAPVAIVICEPAQRLDRLGLQAGAGRDIAAPVVHVAGDPFAIDDLADDAVFAEGIQLATQVQSVAGLLAGGLIVEGTHRLEADLAHDPGRLHVTPVAVQAQAAHQIRITVSAGDVRAQRRVELRDLAGVDRGVGRLQRKGDLHAVFVVRRNAQLRIAYEHHAARSPVVDRVGEGVDVHEQRVVLSCAEPTELAPRIEYARVSVAAAAVEQIEIEQRRELPRLGRDESLESERGLPDAENRLAVLAATRIAGTVHRNLRWPQRRIP